MRGKTAHRLDLADRAAGIDCRHSALEALRAEVMNTRMSIGGGGETMSEQATAGREVQSAELELIAGPLQLRLRASLTPLGILAIGVMMSGIVASASAVVWAGRRGRRALD